MSPPPPSPIPPDCAGGACLGCGVGLGAVAVERDGLERDGLLLLPPPKKPPPPPLLPELDLPPPADKENCR